MKSQLTGLQFRQITAISFTFLSAEFSSQPLPALWAGKFSHSHKTKDVGNFVLFTPDIGKPRQKGYLWGFSSVNQKDLLCCT